LFWTTTAIVAELWIVRVSWAETQEPLFTPKSPKHDQVDGRVPASNSLRSLLSK
jgi:hypothetical protein